MSDLAVTYSALQGMVIGADGSITYDFNGHVHATGLDLDAGGFNPPAVASQVRWLRAGGGVANISAYEIGSSRRLRLAVESGGVGITEDEIELLLDSQSAKTLLNTRFQSHFLQVDFAGAPLESNILFPAPIVWPGSPQNRASADISHGLGTAPVAAIVGCNATNVGGVNVVAGMFAPLTDATTVHLIFQAFTPPAAGDFCNYAVLVAG